MSYGKWLIDLRHVSEAVCTKYCNMYLQGMEHSASDMYGAFRDPLVSVY